MFWQLTDNKHYFCELLNSFLRLRYKVMVESKAMWMKSSESILATLSSIKMMEKHKSRKLWD